MLRHLVPPRARLAVLALLLSVLALLALACGDDGDGGGNSPAPEQTTAVPTAPDGVTPPPTGPTSQPTDNCEPGDGPPRTGEGPDGLPGQIVYVRLIFGCSPDIYIMDSNGDNARVIAESPQLDDESDLSPDGTKVVFFSSRTGSSLLYTVNTDGSGLQQISQGAGGGDVSPRWSPDGQRIAFSRGGSVMVMNADGSERQTVMQSQFGTDAEPCHAGAIVGDWSPDGEKVLYYSAIVTTELTRYWICSVEVASGEVEVLVSEPEDGLHAEPVWSPDGTRIAFRDDREAIDNCGTTGGECNYEIFVLDLETGEETNLTNNPALDIEPFWSPDGEWIAFASTRDDPRFDLYVMRADGSDVQRLLHDPDSKDSYPSWR